MLQLTNHNEQASPSCAALAISTTKFEPQLILTDPTAPEFVPLWEVLWNESTRRRGQILKDIRSSERNVFEQAKAAWKLADTAQASMDVLAEDLPENQKTETPTVRIRWSDDGFCEATSMESIERAFARWIREIGADDPVRAVFFRDRKSEAIRSLVATTEAIIEIQRLNGYWNARVEQSATARAAGLLTYNAYQFRAATVAQCTEVASFLAFMAHRAVEHSHDLNENAVRGCCRRLKASLQTISKPA